MNEIYKNYASQYDKLVKAEDYEKNIDRYLINNIEWKDKVVCEAGIGTGRLSKIYIQQIKKLYGFDREAYMLEQCKNNLKDYLEKVYLSIGQNESLPVIQEKADIFIEGWSFGHTIVEHNNDIQSTTEQIINNIRRNTTVDSVKVIIETLGTNVNAPIYINNDLKQFYRIIEEEYGFKRTIVKTDYKFDDYREAAQIMGFFFGEEMERGIIKRKCEIVPEYTGIWIKIND
jgi:ubiquinone/menaquinone biosynthesis C-methylase UbiE